MRVRERLQGLWRRLRGRRRRPTAWVGDGGLERLLDSRSEEVEDRRLNPAERVLPREVQLSAEDTINASLGLPAVWRCPCGGRPFITENTCPRCGGSMAERWA